MNLENISVNEFNLLKEFPEMDTKVFTQKGCNCCSAIATSGAVGMTYYMHNKQPGLKFEENSPRDIMDCVWHYASTGEGEQILTKQDANGCYNCKSTLYYRHIQSKGVGFLKDYPFENKLNEDKGPVKEDDVKYFPRITISGYKKLNTSAAIFDYIRDYRVVTGCIDITESFQKYKEGIYEQSSNEWIYGSHCVIIIGFNEADNYVRIKNSWGAKWGIGGFGMIKCNSIRNAKCVIKAYEITK